MNHGRPPRKFLRELGNDGTPRPRAIAGRVPLARGIEEGIEPPEELEPDILIRGDVHEIFAASGTGKTWVMLWLVKRCVERGQKVVLFDAENGTRIVSERLGDLGVDTSRLDQLLLYFPYPTLTLEPEAVVSYEALLDEERPALVVFDSLVNFLGGAGLAENSNDDVVAWATRYTRAARERGVTVLLLDHVPHEGGHARGASRKKDEVDVMWSLKNPLPFDRDTVGRITLKSEKDRESWLPERVGFSVGGAGDGFVFRRSDGTVEEPRSEDGLKDTERRALDALRDDFTGKGATATEWRKAADQASSTFYRSRNSLMRWELVEQRGDRYHPAPRPDGGGPGSSETRTKTGDSSNSQELPANSQGVDGSGAKRTPRTPRGLRPGSPGSSSGNGGEEPPGAVVPADRAEEKHLVRPAESKPAGSGPDGWEEL